jgi:hypothetical protein
MVNRLNSREYVKGRPNREEAQRLLDDGAVLIVNHIDESKSIIFMKIFNRYVGTHYITTKGNILENMSNDEIQSSYDSIDWVTMREEGWWEYFKPGTRTYARVYSVDILFEASNRGVHIDN